MLTAYENIALIPLILFAVAFLVGLLAFGVASFATKFISELRQLNNEILRTTGEEKKYWIGRRRRLWLSLIPFIKY